MSESDPTTTKWPGTAGTALALLCVVGFATAADPPAVGLDHQPGKVVLMVGDRPVATYVFQAAKIRRPYFAHVHAPGGIQVTRNHPPVDGKDRTDHADMHPGVWMAFGDLDGSDFWRNPARVVHETFLQSPAGGVGKGTFAVRNRYVTLFCHPENFRSSWLHARDYGPLTANPFGRRAFQKGEPSKVIVRPGESFRLRYGVLLHSGPEGSRPDLKAASADFLQLMGKLPGVDQSSHDRKAEACSDNGECATFSKGLRHDRDQFISRLSRQSYPTEDRPLVPVLIVGWLGRQSITGRRGTGGDDNHPAGVSRGGCRADRQAGPVVSLQLRVVQRGRGRAVPAT